MKNDFLICALGTFAVCLRFRTRSGIYVCRETLNFRFSMQVQLFGHIRVMVNLIQIRFHRHNLFDLVCPEHGSLHDAFNPDYRINGQNCKSNHKDQIDPLLDFPIRINVINHKGVSDNAHNGNHRPQGQLKGTRCPWQTLPENQHITVQNDVGENPEGASGQNQECQLIAGRQASDIDQNHTHCQIL